MDVTPRGLEFTDTADMPVPYAARYGTLPGLRSRHAPRAYHTTRTSGSDGWTYARFTRARADRIPRTREYGARRADSTRHTARRAYAARARHGSARYARANPRADARHTRRHARHADADTRLTRRWSTPIRAPVTAAPTARHTARRGTGTRTVARIRHAQATSTRRTRAPYARNSAHGHARATGARGTRARRGFGADAE